MIRIACVCVFHGFYFFVNCDRQKQVDPDFTHETRVEKMVEWVTKAHEVRARGLRSWDDRQLSTMIYIMYKCVFLALRHFFLFRPRVFSRALGSVARREPAGTPRRKCGPWPRSVARALGVRSGMSPRRVIPST